MNDSRKSQQDDEVRGPEEQSAKRAKVIRDPVKETHTSHWDLDYLPKEDVDEILKKTDPS